MTNIFSLIFRSLELLLVNMIRSMVSTKFRDRAEYLGTWVMVYLGLGGGFLACAVFIGVNPTLTMSVVSAPVWIFLVFLTNRLVRKLVTKDY